MPAKLHPFQPFLVTSLGDPMGANSCCIFGICSALRTINRGNDGHSSSLLRAAMKFLCAPRSDDEHRELRKWLFTCHCDLQDQLMWTLHHYNHDVPASEALDGALMFLSPALGVALYNQPKTPGKFLKSRKNAATERQPWPCKLEDILPNGASNAEVLDALLRWAIEPGHGGTVFAVIQGLARFWEPFTAELMSRRSVFHLVTAHLHHAANTFSPQAPDAWQWPIVVNTCARFLMGIQKIEGRGLIFIVLDILDTMNAIRLRIEPILELMNGMEDAHAWFDQVRLMAIPESPESDMFAPAPGRIIEGRAEPLNSLEELFLRTFCVIWEVRNRNQCMQLECAASMVKPSAVCSQCGVVRYCSRECQKAGWKGRPDFPHKTICSQICRLREGLEVTDAKAWDFLVAEPGINRSPRRLMDICKQHIGGIDQGIVFAIQVGLIRLSEAKFTATYHRQSRQLAQVGLP
ncbi:hypothetical protein C8R47DRAFT_1087343 [Mycena vitilis]|nr:hypothetical protein C8R47DRAFT_1087343 [Mycena vitilis]